MGDKLPTETRQWVIAEYPAAMVDVGTFRLETAPLPALKDGEVLVQNLMLALDAGMRLVAMNPNIRGYLPPTPLGSPVPGSCVARVLASRHPSFAPGDRISCRLGWKEHGVVSPAEGDRVPDGVDDGTALQMLVNSGMTAYFGVTDILKAKAGEVAVVSAAAGGTGCVAVQILKNRQRSGSKEKCDWLLTIGADHALTHRQPVPSLRSALLSLAPDGIDLFFDNTGGPVLAAVLPIVANRARIALCGAASVYNAADPSYPLDTTAMVTRRARMEGFLLPDYADRFGEARGKLTAWMREGKLVARQTVVEGFERVPEHFASLFQGAQNMGKLVVKFS
ncbi:oxidoreductase [Hyaloraphidium curvatum]|nr:oxidoreductase [Hyaloraphidium curvatum]